jgi:threonine/homoserine/homoserine lactone efflux protein
VPTTANLIGFLALALVVIVVPGPSVVFAVGRALVLGTRIGVISVLGNALGVSLQILVVALGAGALVAASPPLFFVIKVLGALFLVYLGLSAIRHRAAPLELPDESSLKKSKVVRESFFVGITNTKTLVFFLAALPQFVSGTAATSQMLWLGLIFLVIGIASDLVYAVAAGKARSWFANNFSKLALVRGIGGGMLAALGGYMLFEALRSL